MLGKLIFTICSLNSHEYDAAKDGPYNGGPTVVRRPALRRGVTRERSPKEAILSTESILQSQPDAGTTESCAQCGAPLALDQRYCLECGVPRTYLSGMLLERLRAPATQTQSEQPTQAMSPNAMPPNAMPPNGMAPFGAPPSSPAWQRGNVLMLIAGIGVLLLAMGVGVLIGRSGGSSSSASPPPQVITVGGGTGAASTSTTPTTPAEETPTTKTGAGSSSTQHKAKAAEPSGVGSSPSKPAPPSVLKNLHKSGGGSYEQKSKSLPNVVSTS